METFLLNRFFLLLLFILSLTLLANNDKLSQTAYSDFVIFHSESILEEYKHLLSMGATSCKSFLESDDLIGNKRINVYLPSSFRAKDFYPFLDWQAAKALPEKNTILISSKVNLSNLSSTITHELFHIYLYRYCFGQRVPLWLNEGLAVYVSADKRFSHFYEITKAALAGRFLSMRNLENFFPVNSADIELAYAQSYFGVKDLIDTYGKEKLIFLLGKISEGRQNYRECFYKVYGISINNYYASLKKKLAARYKILHILLNPYILWWLLAIIIVWVFIVKRRKIKQEIEELPDIEVEYQE